MIAVQGTHGGSHEPDSRELDAQARERILADLDTNMMVEAGAGSGKTTSLVRRMVALIARGTPVERIAAVTFTRKASNELRERFQLELEERVRDAAADSEERARHDRALRELDRAFLGTIHSFCGRLLHERPLEVNLGPDFREMDEDDFAEAKITFWLRWIERAIRAEDPDVIAASAMGVDPLSLRSAFDRVVGYPDVEFPLADSVLPDIAGCRRELRKLLARAQAMMPRTEPADGWDDLMKMIRRLGYSANMHDWEDVAAFCIQVERLAVSHCKLVQKRWSDDKAGKAAAKALGEDFVAFLQGPVADVVRCWREYRYPVLMRILLRASKAFATERHVTGQLCFEDLLLLCARLLREHPDVRTDLGARYAHLLVDEFQDTDPVQAEVCFLLASDPAQGDDWRTVTPRPGSLFVVGDPKQSIFRFRRADIQTYELVRKRLEACGTVVALTRNFRSVQQVAGLVDGYFEGAFPAAPTPQQAAFSPLLTEREGGESDGVFRYEVTPSGKSKDAIRDADAEMVASWIAERVGAARNVADDFLLIVYHKESIEPYARALSERNVAVATTGAPLPQERELTELLVVLRALADPENAVAVVAALEGLFFGLSPADLYDARQAKLRFSLTHPVSDETSPVGAALMTLHGWWRMAQRHPADVLVDRILADTGLVYHAASQPLGDARTGALLHVVEALRAGSVTGTPAIVDAMERIELLLAADAADAPLRPGRSDAVRIMNLHKAKGLEANVVILCAPLKVTHHEPTICIRRDGDHATGALLVQVPGFGPAGPTPVAHPPRWDEMQSAETAFQNAERERLLYVAVTRARRELVIAQCARTLAPRGEEASLCAPLSETLATTSRSISLPVTPAPGRRTAEGDLSSVLTTITKARDWVERASIPTVRSVTVTESAKQEREERRSYDLEPGPEAFTPGAGVAWGRAVHRALEGAGRGRTGESLRGFIAAVARDEGLDSERGAELEHIVVQVTRSPAWTGLMANGAATFELPLMECRVDGEGVAHLTEGVVDAAVLGPEGWVVVDWKTDNVNGDAWRSREPAYQRQVERYCEMLTALGGQPAIGRVERVRSTATQDSEGG